MPEPGPYGPVQWSRPRPRTLWTFVALYAVTAVYWTVFVSEGRANSLGWLAGLLIVYLLWTGSKVAWITAAIVLSLSVVVSVVEIGMATAPGGHHPIVHVIESVLLAAMLALLLLKETRRFYALESRDT